MKHTVYVPRSDGGRWEVAEARNGSIYFRPEGADAHAWRMVPISQAFGRAVLKTYR